MERLLVLKLEGVDCEAEAKLNGVPLARVNAACPRVTVPVHEYTVAGTNQLELVVWPRPATEPTPAPEPPLPRVGDGKRLARLHVLLPRVGAPADEASARSLGQIEWAAPEGQAYEAPLRLQQDIALPVNFPRWRWIDAPLIDITPTLRAQALALLQELAQELAAGQTEHYLSVVRLRTEELALAYQRRPEEEAPRLREHLLALYEAGRLVWKPLNADGLVLRRVAGGRLLECLDADGLPALGTEADGQGRTLAIPLRLAAVDGKLYVLR